MLRSWVVQPFDVIEHVAASILSATVVASVHLFAFWQPEKLFGRSVAAAMADRTDAAHRTVAGLVLLAGELLGLEESLQLTEWLQAASILVARSSHSIPVVVGLVRSFHRHAEVIGLVL